MSIITDIEEAIAKLQQAREELLKESVGTRYFMDVNMPGGLFVMLGENVGRYFSPSGSKGRAIYPITEILQMNNVEINQEQAKKLFPQAVQA